MFENERYHDPKRRGRAQTESTLVQPDEFLRLLLSRQQIDRSDGRDRTVRCLTDRQTGQRYLVNEVALLRRRKTATD
jgi:hypothetical protein